MTASDVKPAFWYPTKTTTDDTTGSTQVPSTTVTATNYNDNGMDPSYGIATSSVVDPNGAALKTLTGFEAPTSGSLLRRTTRTLPAYATSASTTNSTTSTYYAAGATATDPTSCVSGASPIDQGQRLQFITGATPASGPPVKTEQIYDILGRVVASRYWNGATPDTAWTCTSYDARGRVMKVAYPAYGTEPARTVTITFRAGGDPFTTTTTDTTGTLTAMVDALGRPVSTTDVWGKTTTTTYDAAGRVTYVSSPAGGTSYAHDNAGRVTGQ